MPNAQDILDHIKTSLDGIINPFSNPLAPTPAGLSPDIECALQGKIWKGYDAQGNGICEPVPAPTILPDTPKTDSNIPTISLPPINIYEDLPTPVIIYYPDPTPIPALPPRRLPATPDASTKGGGGTSTEPGKSISVRVSLKDQTYGSLLHEPISNSPVELNYYSSTAFVGDIKAEQEQASLKFLKWLEGTLPEADNTLTNTAMALFVRKVVTPKVATLNTGTIFGIKGITNFIANFINRNVISTLINCRVPIFYTFTNFVSRSGYGSSFITPEYFKNLQLKDLSSGSSIDLSTIEAGINGNAVRLIALRDKVDDEVIPLITYTNDNVHITRNLVSDLQESGLETVVNRLIALSQVVTSGSATGDDNTALLTQLYDNLTALTNDLAFLRKVGLDSISNRVIAVSQVLAGLSAQVDTDVLPLLTQLYDNVTTVNSNVTAIAGDVTRIDDTTIVTGNRLTGLAQIISSPSTAEDNSALLTQLYDNLTALTNDLAFLRKVGLDSISNRVIAVSQVLAGLSAQVDTDVLPLLTQLYDNVTTVNSNVTAIAGDVTRIDDTTIVTGNRLTGLAQIISSPSTAEDNSALLTQLYDNLTALTNDLAFLRKVGLDSISNRVIAVSQVLAGLSAQVDTDVLPLLTQLYDNVTTVNNKVTAIEGDVAQVNDTTIVTGNRLTGLAQIISSPSGGDDNTALLTQLYDNLTALTNDLAFLRKVGLDSISNRVIAVSQVLAGLSAQVNTNVLPLLTQLYDNVTTVNSNVTAIAGDVTRIDDTTLVTGNRLTGLAQIISGPSTAEDNSALLTQLYDLVLTTSNNVDELGSIGLETLVNRLVTLSQIVSKGSGTDNTALLEQLFNLTLSINTNVTELSKVGLETVVNRLITLSGIVRSEAANNNSALLEQLFNLALSINTNVTELVGIGLETVVNRLITLSQILTTSSYISSSNTNGVNLTAIAQRLGFDDFPITLPQSLITKTDAQGNGIAVENEIVESIPQLIVWLVKRIDELLGQWEIPIEIKDIDPTTPGDQSKTMKFPNLAEATAEMLMLLFQISINSEIITNVSTRILMEAGQDKQQNLITYKLLQSLTDYVGYNYKEVPIEMPLLFDPTATEFDKMLTEVKIKVAAPEFDEKLNLQADLMRFRKASSILDSVYFRKVDTNGDIKEQILKRIFDMKDLLTDLHPDQGEKFKEFLRKVEGGFTDVPGVGDPTRPYGNDYEDRPRFKDFTE